MDPTTAIKLKRHPLDTDSVQSPAPQVGDRLVLIYSQPMGAGMSELLAKGGAKIPHSGRLIKPVSHSDATD